MKPQSMLHFVHEDSSTTLRTTPKRRYTTYPICRSIPQSYLQTSHQTIYLPSNICLMAAVEYDLGRSRGICRVNGV